MPRRPRSLTELREDESILFLSSDNSTRVRLRIPAQVMYSSSKGSWMFVDSLAACSLISCTVNRQFSFVSEGESTELGKKEKSK